MLERVSDSASYQPTIGAILLRKKGPNYDVETFFATRICWQYRGVYLPTSRREPMQLVGTCQLQELTRSFLVHDRKSIVAFEGGSIIYFDSSGKSRRSFSRETRASTFSVRGHTQRTVARNQSRFFRLEKFTGIEWPCRLVQELCDGGTSRKKGWMWWLSGTHFVRYGDCVRHTFTAAGWSTCNDLY